MISLYQRTWSREELVRRVGHMDQLAGIRLVEGGDGLARGSRMLEVWTGGGTVYFINGGPGPTNWTCCYSTHRDPT